MNFHKTPIYVDDAFELCYGRDVTNEAFFLEIVECMILSARPCYDLRIDNLIFTIIILLSYYHHTTCNPSTRLNNSLLAQSNHDRQCIDFPNMIAGGDRHGK